MDIRNEITRKVVGKLKNRVPNEVVEMVHDALAITLNEYEVQERNTEVALVDDMPEKMLAMYLGTLRLEGKSEKTITRYYEVDRKLIRFLRKPLEEVNTNDIRCYMAYRRQSGAVSNRTLDGERRCFSSFFSWLSDEGYIGKNPVACMKQIKYRKEIKKPFSDVELEKIRISCKTKRDRALVEFLYSTGCRVSEVVELELEDIDFEQNQLTVLGKGNKERTVFLSPVCVMHLREYIKARKYGAIFNGKGSERLSKNGIEAALRKVGERAGVENVHPHRFRRTLATNLLNRGMSIQDVAEILGHADLKTTQIYCYIDKKNVENAYRKYAD